MINDIKDNTFYNQEKMKDESYNHITVQYVKRKE